MTPIIMPSVPSAAGSAGSACGRAVVVERRLVGALHLRDDLLGEDLAELHPPRSRQPTSWPCFWPQHDLHAVFPAVVFEWNLRMAVAAFRSPPRHRARPSRCHGSRPRGCRLRSAIVCGSIPAFRKHIEAEYRLQTRPVQPSGRAGVPCPAAAVGQRCDRVHIRTRDVGLDLVTERSPPHCRHHRLCRRRRAWPRRRWTTPSRACTACRSRGSPVALDVTRILPRAIEWRREQHRNPVLSIDQARVHCRHRLRGARRIGDS